MAGTLDKILRNWQTLNDAIKGMTPDQLKAAWVTENDRGHRARAYVLKRIEQRLSSIEAKSAVKNLKGGGL